MLKVKKTMVIEIDFSSRPVEDRPIFTVGTRARNFTNNYFLNKIKKTRLRYRVSKLDVRFERN